MNITPERLRELLHYDPSTGKFTNLVTRGNWQAGREVGTQNGRGYLVIEIGKKRYRAHRLAFLYMTGCWPRESVDHIDGGRSNNRWVNLREVSRTVNQQNRRKANSGNKTGLLGVSIDLGRFRARIRSGGKMVRIGVFDTAQEAHQAYLIAKRQLHQGCTI